MGGSLVSRCFPLLVFLLSAASTLEAIAKKNPFSFSFTSSGGKGDSFGSEIALYGDARINGSVVRMTSPTSSSSAGRMVYKKSIRLVGRNPGFSSSISFSMASANEGALAFFMAPTSVSQGSTDGLGLGLLPSVLAVEFLASTDSKSNDSSKNFISVIIGSERSVKSRELSEGGLILDNGEVLHSWIDYDGDSKRLEVRLSKSKVPRPSKSLISYPIDLSGWLWREPMIVGISSSSQIFTQPSLVFAWSFVTKHGAPFLMHSEPLDPQLYPVHPDVIPPVHHRKVYLYGILMTLVLGAACGALVAFIVLFVWSTAIDRRPVAPQANEAKTVEFADEKLVLVGDKVSDVAAK